jgi:hypothetical protein
MKTLLFILLFLHHGVLEDRYVNRYTEKDIVSQQCLGQTKTGNRCKNKTNNVSGYCYIHEDQAPGSDKVKLPPKEYAVQCSSTTKAGTRCSRMVKSQNGKCFQHGGN